MTATFSGPASIQVAFVGGDLRLQGALQSCIDQTDDMRLVHMAGTLAQARLLLSKRPAADVLLVDLDLPDGSGIEVIAAAARTWPTCAVVVCAEFGDEAHVLQAIEAGAAGYLLKDSAPRLIVGEIRSMHAGSSPINPLIARKLLTRVQLPSVTLAPPSGATRVAAGSLTLTEGERDLLRYFTKGFTAQEIAASLRVSHHTVLVYVRRIYAKLRLSGGSAEVPKAGDEPSPKDLGRVNERG